jgi:hypothetical protein
MALINRSEYVYWELMSLEGTPQWRSFIKNACRVGLQSPDFEVNFNTKTRMTSVRCYTLKQTILWPRCLHGEFCMMRVRGMEQLRCMGK